MAAFRLLARVSFSAKQRRVSTNAVVVLLCVRDRLANRALESKAHAQLGHLRCRNKQCKMSLIMQFLSHALSSSIVIGALVQMRAIEYASIHNVPVYSGCCAVHANARNRDKTLSLYMLAYFLVAGAAGRCMPSLPRALAHLTLAGPCMTLAAAAVCTQILAPKTHLHRFMHLYLVDYT